VHIALADGHDGGNERRARNKTYCFNSCKKQTQSKISTHFVSPPPQQTKIFTDFVHPRPKFLGTTTIDDGCPPQTFVVGVTTTFFVIVHRQTFQKCVLCPPQRGSTGVGPPKTPTWGGEKALLTGKVYLVQGFLSPPPSWGFWVPPPVGPLWGGTMNALLEGLGVDNDQKR